MKHVKINEEFNTLKNFEEEWVQPPETQSEVFEKVVKEEQSISNSETSQIQQQHKKEKRIIPR